MGAPRHLGCEVSLSGPLQSVLRKGIAGVKHQGAAEAGFSPSLRGGSPAKQEPCSHVLRLVQQGPSQQTARPRRIIILQGDPELSLERVGESFFQPGIWGGIRAGPRWGQGYLPFGLLESL